MDIASFPSCAILCCLTQNLISFFFFFPWPLSDSVLQRTAATLCRLFVTNAPQKFILAANVVLLFISFPDHLWIHWIVRALSQISVVPHYRPRSAVEFLSLISHLAHCCWLTTGSPLQKQFSFLRIVGEGHCQKNTVQKWQKPPCPGSFDYSQLVPEVEKKSSNLPVRNVGICQLMAVFEGAIRGTSGHWHNAQGHTKGWKMRGRGERCSNGRCSSLPVQSLPVWSHCQVSDGFQCRRAVRYVPVGHRPHPALKNKPNPSLPPGPQTLPIQGGRKKRWFQVVLLQDLYTECPPLSVHTCTGSTSLVRQPDLKSLAGLGTLVVLAHADLQLQNVYLAVKSLPSNKLWWIQRIVFSSFFGMLFASGSHGEHIASSVYHKYSAPWVTASVCRAGMSHALPATLKNNGLVWLHNASVFHLAVISSC